MSFVRSFSVALAAAAMVLAASSAYAAGDAAQGKKIFNRCRGCHSLQAGRQMYGPSLHDVYGREAGSLAGYKQYSKGLKDAKFHWDEKHLDEWLSGPGKMIKGARMMFELRKEKDRQNVIAYLKEMSKK